MVVGATGYVGRALTLALLADGAEVVAPGRRPLLLEGDEVRWQPALTTAIADLSQPHLWPWWPGVSALFLCLGASGGRGYADVDEQLTLTIAREAALRGVAQLQVVSSLGASMTSAIPYLRSKGRMEAAISALEPASIVIWQPGPLLGRQPLRVSELLMRPLFALAGWATGGRHSPLTGVTAEQLAAAMVASYHQPPAGVVRYGSPAILNKGGAT